jgi:hypothetical protein
MKRVKIQPRKVRLVHGPQYDEAHLLLEESISPPYPPGWSIKVYNIGKLGRVGARYPDCYQEHSILWWKERLEKAGHDLVALGLIAPPPSTSPCVKPLSPLAALAPQRVKIRPRP